MAVKKNKKDVGSSQVDKQLVNRVRKVRQSGDGIFDSLFNSDSSCLICLNPGAL